MLDKLKEKIAAVVANAVIIGGVFGIVVPEAQILDVTNASFILAGSILTAVAGWQAAVFKK